jgi:hypothetical protein
MLSFEVIGIEVVRRFQFTISSHENWPCGAKPRACYLSCTQNCTFIVESNSSIQSQNMETKISGILPSPHWPQRHLQHTAIHYLITKTLCTPAWQTDAARACAESLVLTSAAHHLLASEPEGLLEQPTTSPSTISSTCSLPLLHSYFAFMGLHRAGGTPYTRSEATLSIQQHMQAMDTA